MEHDVHHRHHHQPPAPPMELPAGFRFHPTDEELITHYLARKAADPRFAARAVGEADLNKCEPWDLPSMAVMGDKEWYFFCVKDRKYPTGMRTNRATESGYWKATGKDREILRGKALVGMKKTLVFYTGRAPRGGKTGWVMHEYRLHATLAGAALPRSASRDDWVLCRVFKKSSDPPPGAGRRGTCAGVAADVDLASCALPPLMDVSGGGTAAAATASFSLPAAAHVTCFSNALEGEFLNPPYLLPSPPAAAMATAAAPFLESTTPVQYQYYAQGGGACGMVHELLQDHQGGGWHLKGEREMLIGGGGASQDTGLTSEVNPAEISSSRQHHVDHEASLWGY